MEVRKLWSSLKWYGSKEILRWNKFLAFFANWFSSSEVTHLDQFSNVSVSELVWLKNLEKRV